MRNEGWPLKYLGLTDLNYNEDKKLKHHHDLIKAATNRVDSGPPRGYTDSRNQSTSPGKRHVLGKERNDLIAKDNLLLARRIFNIMEAPGLISDGISDTRHLDAHPGTMNFKARLEEAQRIHHHNMSIAARLDNVKPYYDKSDLFVVLNTRKKIKRAKKSRILDADVNNNNGDDDNPNTNSNNNAKNDGSLTHRSDTTGKTSGSKSARLKIGFNPKGQGHPLSARKAEEGGKAKPQNVLLEYTKIQDGRILDVAVIKEPFRDRYAIFGIDIDDAQRYELRLSSEEVSNILDGDILVTSVDNIEVWMALLNKVKLTRVDAFAKLPTSDSPEDVILSNNSNVGNAGGGSSSSSSSSSSTNTNKAAPQSPTKPTSNRPTTRPGGRGGSGSAGGVVTVTAAAHPQTASRASSAAGASPAPAGAAGGGVSINSATTTPTRPLAVSRNNKESSGVPTQKERSKAKEKAGGQQHKQPHAGVPRSSNQKSAEEEDEKKLKLENKAAIAIQAKFRGSKVRSSSPVKAAEKTVCFVS